MATTPEPQEPILAFNLPELLAVDLERSRTVFRSSQLTFGAPAPSVTIDGSRRRYSLQDMSLGLDIPSRPRLSRPCRANSLRNLPQSYLPDLELSCNWTQLPREDKDYYSSPETPTSSESSFGCGEPLSAGTIRTDITTPTTAASDLQPPPLSINKNRISTLNRGDISWIDFDDEIEPIEEVSSDQLEMDSSFRRRGRVYDPRGESVDSNLHHEEPSAYMRGYGRPRAFTNARARETSPFDPQRLSNRPAEIPQRQSSLGYTDVDGQADMASHMSLPAHRLVTSRTVPDTSLVYPPTPTSDSEFDMKDENNATVVDSERVARKSGNSQRPEKVDEETQESPSKTVVSAVNLENSLKTTLESFMQYSPPATNGPTTRMRLPAHVTDTLRVSVSCFPETMLMCSSLSIETIRSHSRKLKTPPSSSSSSSRPRTALPPDLPADRPKTPWYSKLAPSKSSYRLDPDQGMWASEPTVLKKMPPAAAAPARGAEDETPLRPETPCWAVIRSVFPQGTDFLCEALYAHIVAYNYITTLCPRGSFAGPAIATRRTTPTAAANIERASSPSPSSPEMRPQRIPTHDDRETGTGIPNKAINFLGMPGATNGPPEVVSPMAPMPMHTYLPPLPPVPPEGNSRFSALRSKKSLQFLFKGEGNNNSSHNGNSRSGRFNDNSSTESLNYGYSSGGSSLHLPSANHHHQQTQNRPRNMNPLQQYQHARQRGGGGGGLKASATWAGLPNPSPMPNVPFFRRPSNQQPQPQSQSSSRPASSASSVASRRAPVAAEERYAQQQQMRRQQQKAREKEREERDLQELRLGLARCVARLMATLRLACLATEGSDGVAPSTPATQTQIKIDPLFMRALCELVRACEEKPVAGPDR